MAGLPRFRWTLNRSLAAAAVGLGVIGLAGHPAPGHTVRIDTQELATIVAGKVDHVTAPQLADWILRGAADYRLVDVRTPEEFAASHLPTAENIPITSLPDAGLARTEKIVLYSEGGIHSAQAWMLLRAQGYRGVTTLFGGLDAWNDEVLHPAAPADSTPASLAAFAKATAVARAFGGSPRPRNAGGAFTLAPEPAAAPATPAVVAPRSPAARQAAGGAKRKEGC